MCVNHRPIDQMSSNSISEDKIISKIDTGDKNWVLSIHNFKVIAYLTMKMVH